MKNPKTVKYSLAAPARFVKHERFEKSPGRYRNQFERDRDRILYSKEFRRLSGKTQVFLSLTSDHVRTRLTHTLEVSQIARVTARNLKLNVDLSEGISLAHDVGHTPFGHVGERTLNEVMNGCNKLVDQQANLENKDKGFKHNLQGLRVTSELESLYENVGLNLTNFTLWGIKNHSSSKYDECESIYRGKCYLGRSSKDCYHNGKLKIGFYDNYNKLLLQKENIKEAWSFEAKVVELADEIAQRHHDIEDAFFMNIMDADDFIEVVRSFFKEYLRKEDNKLLNKIGETKKDKGICLPYISKFIVNFLNRELIDNSIKNLNRFISDKQITRKTHFANIYNDIELEEIHNLIGYEKDLNTKEKEFKAFLKGKILSSFEAQRMDGKGRFIIKRLFKAYLTNPNQLRDSTLSYVYRIYMDRPNERPSSSPSEVNKIRTELNSASLKSEPRFQISLLRGICDHIAGMTDRYAFQEYQALYN